jgi:hypothetical protein
VDHVPLEPELPRPRLPALALLVGRITTIKLAYWTALTAAEIVVGAAGFDGDDRTRLSLLAGLFFTVVACTWAAVVASAVDPRAGALERSIPTVATAFVAASVVATPASLPLLFVEVSRRAIWYWVAAVAIGTVVIPLVFALRMRPASALPRS